MDTKIDFPDDGWAPAEHFRLDLRAELSATSFQALERIGSRRRFRSNEFLQHRGSPADHALLVLAGRVRVQVYLPDGTPHLMRWLVAGELTGMSSVAGDAPVPADLLAEGAVEVLHLPGKPLVELLARDASISLALVKMLSLRVNELHSLVFSRGSDPLDTRVWTTLQRLARANGEPLRDGTGIGLPMSQEDLAHAVCASRQRVNEVLRALQAEGRVRLGYRRIELLRPRK